MASKSLSFLVAAFLLVSIGVCFSEEELKEKAYGKMSAPAGVPTKAPNPTPPTVVKQPTPPPPLAKPPAPAPPVIKPPVPLPPPVPPIKPPTTPLPPPTFPPPVPPIKPPTTPLPPPTFPPPVPPIKPPTTPLPPPTTPPMPPVRTIADCTPLCAGRCKLHSRPNVCNRACKACCFRCKCVPPGTYGNREQCGKCYTDMTTRHNKPKCP